MRLMLMRWFQYTIQDFENSLNPPNASFLVLERRINALNGRRWYQPTEESLDVINFEVQNQEGSLWKLLQELRKLDPDYGGGDAGESR